MPSNGGSNRIWRSARAVLTSALRWIEADPAAFREKFDRTGFAFAHGLAYHPLFALERLIELAKSLADTPGNLVYDAGDVRVDQRWDEVPFCNVPAHVLIENIATAGAWILLKHANTRPGYRELLDELLTDVEALAAVDLAGTIKAKKSIVFLNSPNRVTSYHIDHQCTFLLQIAGTKTISIFDRYDRDVLPETELERFWTRDENAARFKPAYQDRATVIELQPGMGVHIPVNAPHWVQNGPDVSVSLNINVDFHDGALGDIYRANYWLRRFGAKPLPPGVSVNHDSAKRRAYAALRALRGIVRRK